MAALHDGVDGPSWSFLQGLLRQNSTQVFGCVEAPSLESPCTAGRHPESEMLAAAWFSVVLDEAELIDVRVAPASRRQGIGKALLTAALVQLNARGVACCHLDVRRSNRAARALYHELGFVHVGERPNYYRFRGRQEDAILLRLSPLL